MKTITEQAQEFYKSGERRIRFYFKDHKPKIKRLGMTRNDELILMTSGRRGIYFTDEKIEQYFSCYGGVTAIKAINKTPSDVKWLKDVKRAIKLLEKSGLWENILKDFKRVEKLGWNTWQKIYELNNTTFCKGYEENKAEQVKRIKEIMPELIKTNDEGKEYIDTDFLWHWSNKISIKKMNFCEGEANKYKLAQIKEALENKTDIHITGRRNYDISFEYKGDSKRAWYSEEYKGCGNGHYYLALNHEYALYYEDD